MPEYDNPYRCKCGSEDGIVTYMFSNKQDCSDCGHVFNLPAEYYSELRKEAIDNIVDKVLKENEGKISVGRVWKTVGTKPCRKCNSGTVIMMQSPVSIVESPTSYDPEERSKSGVDSLEYCDSCDHTDGEPADLS